MGKEIERKFLVDTTKWEAFKKEVNSEKVQIIQAYIGRTELQTSRVRIKSKAGEQKAYLTIKGKTKGITRSEFEYEIPVSEAKAMISEFCAKHIDKVRYTFNYQDKTWEVDEFTSPKTGLVLAEVELNTEKEAVDLPYFIKEDVSTDPQYFNVNML
ncbi:CYTH domain-containing protein [Lishizhenia sp.]|uniref:CYTH domain-containing protein n=1 Tax=Lishizhenia sp. TaxID=2497594 RepID=UPI00299EED1B|nr:CYTH domain-containing protein [Lishizhenia sp.]MDX1445663.1 CYTH domain-containing protein [Lishizhenia sp.]